MTVIFALTSKFPRAANSKHTATSQSSIISFGAESLSHQRITPLGLQQHPSELQPLSEHSDVPAFNEIVLTGLCRKKRDLSSPRELTNKENDTSIPWLDGKMRAESWFSGSQTVP